MKAMKDSGETVTKYTLTEKLHKEIGFSIKDCNKIVDAVIEELINGVKSCGSMKISSFGSLSVKEKKERIGRNPKTKKTALIKSRKVIAFKASSKLKKLINN